MRTFLDTNVLVSAFVARGLCADLFRYLLAEHEILTGEVNLVELRRTLRDKFDASPEQIAMVLNQLREQTVVPKSRKRSALRLRDRSDEAVLASAILGHADLLITGDKDLLTVAGSTPVRIVSPRQAWEELRATGKGTT